MIINLFSIFEQEPGLALCVLCNLISTFNNVSNDDLL